LLGQFFNFFGSHKKLLLAHIPSFVDTIVLFYIAGRKQMSIASHRTPVLSLVIVRKVEGVLIAVDEVVDDLAESHIIFHLGEDVRSRAAHFLRVALHHSEVGADREDKVGFVYDEKVGLSDARTTFARDFVATGDVNNLNGVIGKLAAEAGGQIIATGFQQEKIWVEFLVEFFERQEISGNILTNRCMRAAARFNGANSFGGKRLVPDEEFAIFFSENVVGDSGDAEAITEMAAELQHEGRLPATNRPAHAHGKSAMGEVAMEREFAMMKMTGVIEVFVSVAVITVRMRV
jgi:hypothetical protein